MLELFLMKKPMLTLLHNINNNDKSNQDIIKNNNQVSNNDNAESEGNTRATIYEEINKQFFCQIVVAEASKG